MCERLWRSPEAKECPCLAILAPSSDVGYNRRLCRGLCAGAGGMFLQPCPCGCGVGLGPPLSSCLRSCAAMGRAGMEPRVQDRSLSCAASRVPYVSVCGSRLSL